MTPPFSGTSRLATTGEGMSLAVRQSGLNAGLDNAAGVGSSLSLGSFREPTPDAQERTVMTRLDDYELPPNGYLVSDVRRSGTSNDWRADLDARRAERKASGLPYKPRHQRR